MLSKLHHFVIDFLIGLGGFLFGLGALHLFRLKYPVKGISGAQFMHTIGNVNKLMAEQNKEVARLSADLTAAQIKIDTLITENRMLRVQNELLEKRIKALADEVEKLLSKLNEGTQFNTLN